MTGSAGAGGILQLGLPKMRLETRPDCWAGDGEGLQLLMTPSNLAQLDPLRLDAGELVDTGALAQAGEVLHTGELGRWLSEHAPSEIPHLPPMAHTAVGIALIVGLMLWAFGGRVVKPAFAVLGFVAGGMFGMAAAPALGVEAAFGLEATTLSMLGGGLIGVIASAILFRAAMTATATTTLAAAGLMAGLIAAPRLQLEPPPALASLGFDQERETAAGDDSNAQTLFTNQPIPEQPASWQGDPIPLGLAAPTAVDDTATLEDGGVIGTGEIDAMAASASDFAREASERVGAFAAQAWEAAMVAFEALAPNERYTVAVFTLGGGVLGMLLGSLFPRKAASLVTALLGSAIVLSSLGWMVLALELPGAELLNRPTEQLAIAWLIAALLGMIYQSSGHRSGQSGSSGE